MRLFTKRDGNDVVYSYYVQLLHMLANWLDDHAGKIAASKFKP